MRFEHHSVWGKLARLWLMLVAAVLGSLLLAPRVALTLGEDATSCPTCVASPVPNKTVSCPEGNFTAGGIGLPVGPCQFDPSLVSENIAGQASGTGQIQSTSTAQSSPTESEQERLKVNPLTGLALASQSSYTPLTGSERWNLYLKMTYASAGPYLSPTVNALLLDQANGTPPQWGGGFAGFGRRLASRAGNAVLQGTFQAPLAAILHEDVRYIPTSQHSLQRRALHAVLYSFLTYNDKGHPTLNIANLTAFYASTAVTTAWIPGVGNAVKYTFRNASDQIALSFPLNVVQEFWPEIRHHIFRRQ